MTIYTDGSCHTQLLAGAWVALIYHGETKTILQGTEANTTHHRMELTAVIEALKYISRNNDSGLDAQIITDSQYVAGLKARREKFVAQQYKTKQGKDIANVDLVKQYLALEATLPVQITKIKAHQKAGQEGNHNIEADLLCRGMVRKMVAGASPILPGGD
jgi:ribonuclease HI